MNQLKSYTISLILLVSFLSGCAAIKSFPESARSGETITLAVGSPEGMSRQNILVEYYPDSEPSTPYDITPGLRSVFKLYPDKASKLMLFDDSPFFPVDRIARDTGHAAWLTVITLDLPTLPVGTGVIKVTPTSPSIIYGGPSENIENVDIALEILPGSGLADDFGFIPIAFSGPITRTLSDLEPAPQLIVTPPLLDQSSGGDTRYGAIEMKITIPWLTESSLPAPNKDIFVILDPKNKMNLRTQLSLQWKRVGDEFTIMQISPKGMLLLQSKFSVVARPTSTLNSANVGISSIKFYDLDGFEVTGPLSTEYTLLTEGI